MTYRAATPQRKIVLLTQHHDADEVPEDAEAAGDDGEGPGDDGDDVVIVSPLVILATGRVNEFYNVESW